MYGSNMAYDRLGKTGETQVRILLHCERCLYCFLLRASGNNSSQERMAPESERWHEYSCSRECHAGAGSKTSPLLGDKLTGMRFPEMQSVKLFHVSLEA